MTTTPAHAGAEPFLGQVVMYPYNFCPRGWTSAQGQLMSIAANTALFSLLGTTYGGNGTTTFALPDLQGRGIIGQGNGPGLTPRVLGEEGGTTSTTLMMTQMPIHTHQTLMKNSSQGANSTRALRNGFAVTDDDYQPGAPPTPAAYLNEAAAPMGLAGGGQPFSNQAPYLTLFPCIALSGIFPQRP
ncbi:MAG: hypothetical protein HEQ22_07465 [Sphingopyxis sp.]